MTIGEELGWRGYMLTRLIDAGIPRPLLASGVIWWLFHLAPILAGIHAAGPVPAMSALLFFLSVTPSAYFAARVRLESGSIWPPVLLHATWNVVLQGVFERFTMGGGASRTTNHWVGESGALVAVASVGVGGSRRSSSAAPGRSATHRLPKTHR